MEKRILVIPVALKKYKKEIKQFKDSWTRIGIKVEVVENKRVNPTSK